jgi:hypothetical protein
LFWLATREHVDIGAKAALCNLADIVLVIDERLILAGPGQNTNDGQPITFRGAANGPGRQLDCAAEERFLCFKSVRAPVPADRGPACFINAPAGACIELGGAMSDLLKLAFERFRDEAVRTTKLFGLRVDGIEVTQSPSTTGRATI